MPCRQAKNIVEIRFVAYVYIWYSVPRSVFILNKCKNMAWPGRGFSLDWDFIRPVFYSTQARWTGGNQGPKLGIGEKYLCLWFIVIKLITYLCTFLRHLKVSWKVVVDRVKLVFSDFRIWWAPIFDDLCVNLSARSNRVIFILVKSVLPWRLTVQERSERCLRTQKYNNNKYNTVHVQECCFFRIQVNPSRTILKIKLSLSTK